MDHKQFPAIQRARLDHARRQMADIKARNTKSTPDVLRSYDAYWDHLAAQAPHMEHSAMVASNTFGMPAQLGPPEMRHRARTPPPGAQVWIDYNLSRTAARIRRGEYSGRQGAPRTAHLFRNHKRA